MWRMDDKGVPGQNQYRALMQHCVRYDGGIKSRSCQQETREVCWTIPGRWWPFSWSRCGSVICRCRCDACQGPGGVAKDRQSVQRKNRTRRVESQRMAGFKEREQGVGECRRTCRKRVRRRLRAVSVPDFSGKADTPTTTSTFLGQPRHWGGCKW